MENRTRTNCKSLLIFNILENIILFHLFSQLALLLICIGRKKDWEVNVSKTAYAYQDLLKQKRLACVVGNWFFPWKTLIVLKRFWLRLLRKRCRIIQKMVSKKKITLTEKQTLRGMTIWAAKSVFEEKEKKFRSRKKMQILLFWTKFNEYWWERYFENECFGNLGWWKMFIIC